MMDARTCPTRLVCQDGVQHWVTLECPFSTAMGKCILFLSAARSSNPNVIYLEPAHVALSQLRRHLRDNSVSFSNIRNVDDSANDEAWQGDVGIRLSCLIF